MITLDKIIQIRFLILSIIYHENTNKIYHFSNNVKYSKMNKKINFLIICKILILNEYIYKFFEIKIK